MHSMPTKVADNAHLAAKVFNGCEKSPNAFVQGIPEKVEAVIRTACQYRADDRFRTATEMADVLEKIDDDWAREALENAKTMGLE